MTNVEIPITNIPRELFDSIWQRLSDYTIGFLRVKDTPAGQDADLLGSGTLVQIGTTRAILTAHHVVDVLPTEGRLGLILSRNLSQHNVDSQGLSYLKIARGEIESKGPDLAAVILSPTIASSIGAIKSFYNLANHRDNMLTDPPDIQEGVWINNGFVAELTIQEEGRNGYSSIKGFFILSGVGGPENQPAEREEYDYISLPVTYSKEPGLPTSFGGMSGGGLWQVQLITGPSGVIKPNAFLLSGVVFYQEGPINQRSDLICHGRSSVYQVAYEAIKQSQP
jgi:hypothetical protein